MGAGQGAHVSTPSPPAPLGPPSDPYAAPPVAPYSGRAYPAQPYPAQPYPALAYPPPGNPGHPYAPQAYPSQAYPSQGYPGSTLPGTPYARAPQLPTGLALGSLFTGLGALVIGAPFTLGVGGVVIGLGGLVLGVTALRRVRAGTGGGRAYAWWGVGLSVAASVAGAALFAALVPQAAEEFQQGWDSAAEPEPADAPNPSAVEDAWDDGYDAGYEDGYVGARYPLPAPGTEDSQVDPADVVQRTLGEPATVGAYTVTVLAVSLDADDVVATAFPGNVEPEGRYVLATVSITNAGAEPVRPAADLYHYYPGDDDLLHGDWSCAAWTPRPLLDVGPLAPGESAEYDVCFDVPLHALGSPMLVLDDARATEYRLTQWSAPAAG